MFIRGTRLTVPTDKIGAMIEHFRDEVAPKAKEVSGNRGAVLLIDRKRGDGWGLTYWEDEDALKASEDAGSALRDKVVEKFGATVQDVDRFEVAFVERTAPPRSGTFSRVNDIKGDPARLEEGIRYTRETALPQVRGQKGFISLITAVNRQSGRGVTTTSWATLEDLEASEAAAAPVRKGALAAIGAKSVDVHIYDVAFADVSVPIPRA